MKIDQLIEELKNTRQLTKQLEDSIRYENFCKVQHFKEEFDQLCGKHKDVKISIGQNIDGYPIIIAKVNNPEGMAWEEMRLV
jgi:hypothetical protein